MQLIFGMIKIALSPADRRWMKVRLLRTCKLSLLFLVLSVAADFNPHASLSSAAGSNQSVATSDSRRSEIPELSNRTLNAKSQDDNWFLERRSVPPSGWRKTNRGWERVSTWAGYGPPINELIHTQKASEPAWAQVVFARLTNVSPITIALIQIFLITAICAAANSKLNPGFFSRRKTVA